MQPLMHIPSTRRSSRLGMQRLPSLIFHTTLPDINICTSSHLHLYFSNLSLSTYTSTVSVATIAIYVYSRPPDTPDIQIYPFPRIPILLESSSLIKLQRREDVK